MKLKTSAKLLGLFVFGMVLAMPVSAYAACTNPASPVGGIAYGSAGDLSTMLACDGTNWVPWAGWGITGYPPPQYSAGGGGSSFWTQGAGDDIYYNSGVSHVGIGKTNPIVALDVVGDINFTGQIVDVSDIRMKYDIAPLDSPLRKLTALNGFSFKMRGDERHTTEYGVSAQDVQKVFPELVSVVDPARGTLGVNYNGLIAPMIEAMKEQQREIEALRAEIQTLKAAQAATSGAP